MAMVCEVLPVSAFQSTNLNSKIETFDRLGDRIKRALGWPLISLEIHQDQLYENIQIAVEMYTKYAGYTKEYLVFDSILYETNKGIRLDHLYTISNTGLTDAQKIAEAPKYSGADFTITSPQAVFIATSALPSSTFTTSTTLSGLLATGVTEFEIVDQSIYSMITGFDANLGDAFKASYQKTFSLESVNTTAFKKSNVFDYDLMDYRKVIAITDFEEGSNTGINTLFTLEQTLAQQTYFSYAMGNYGFDLVSWYTMKEWLDMREKILATKRDVKFDNRTQYMQMYPQPKTTSRFWGVVSCYVERPIRDIIKEAWVYQYALALSKITIGMVRSKFTGVALLGGGALNYDLLSKGYEEKERLEEQLYNQLGLNNEQDYCDFFVG